MQTTVTKKSPFLLSIEVKESGAEFEKAQKLAIEDFRKNGKINGFKPGTAPDNVIIKQFGQSAIDQHAVDIIIDKIYPKILKKENIIPVAPGNITELKSTNPLEFVIEVEIFPEVTIDEKKLDAIKVKKTNFKVMKKEIDEEIEAIKRRFTHYHEAGVHADDGADTSHTAIENGDRATVTAQGYDKKGGDAIPETAVPSYPLVIGSGNFIPGFEEKLIGAKAGDEVAFDITFPADYHSEEFKGRKVHFVVNVEKVEKPHTPEFTEDFIEKLRGVKTDLEGFKEIIKKEISARKETENRRKDEDTLMKKMLEAATIEVGPALVANEVNQVFAEHSENLAQQGLNMKQYLEHIKMDEEAYKETVVKPEAERRLNAELLLRKIREIRKVEATEAEIKEELEKIIAQYQNAEVVARLREKLVPGDMYYEDIKNRLAYRKTVDMFWE
ncbi:trigger factor [Candidatus Gracilibacteria bacterium GN02-873]|nr:trigger factor [Candidatus Gracilibacteria bacterium GN02-873]